MKTKLIKLSDTHYIIVDDSEIKLNDWVYSMDGVHQWFGLVLKTEPLPKKITHSTQPLYKNDFWAIKELKLSEVEEAIYGYSIYQKALDFAVTSKIYIDDEKTHDEVAESLISFHKELVKDKLFTIQDMQKCYEDGFASRGTDSPVKDFQLYAFEEGILHSETEWDVTFDEQGKIKLV